MEKLEGKVAVVTGAASGIGQAIASRFVAHGAMVVLCDRNEAALKTSIETLGEAAVAHPADVSDEAEVEATMARAVEAFGGLDIVVNCAGFGHIAPLVELSGEDWNAVHSVTLSGVFYGVKHAARLMLSMGHGGVILNVSSVNGQQPGEGQSAYCAAKAGVDMLTRCAALELGPKGIRVVGVAPGLVRTPLTAHELEDPNKRALFMGVIPLGRAAEPAEIADAVVYLVSDAAGYINGSTLLIDGGSGTRGYPALLTGGVTGTTP